ncbi:MAG: arginine repressor [Tannerella sp.]|jgi:transcriptional regulator of arginine metabolism|nr:arginine repressor [Tannerella sp.]
MIKGKKERLAAIEDIVRREIIRNQDDLQKSLIDRGFEVVQATLSRDIRELKIVKVLDEEGRYLYVLPDAGGWTDNKQGANVSRGVISLEFSGTLAVIKTRPGYAGGIASDIDEHSHEVILGTIAGDDTILIIPREGRTKDEVRAALGRLNVER